MKWIPIDERTPDEKGIYLVYAPSGDTDQPLIQRAVWNGTRWEGIFPVWDVTHWQVIEEPEDADNDTCD